MNAAPIFPSGSVTILGVVNVTPDSFSDGGRFVDESDRLDLDAAVRAGRQLLEDGADWLDVGGESTRPGAADVPADVELDRVVPVVEALVAQLGARVSVDTRKAVVARAGLAAGARAVNDVSGGTHDPELLGAVAAFADAFLILGHIRGTPANMQNAPHYDDALREVASELEACVEQAERAGVARERLAIDPGIGFGKGERANLELIAHCGWLRDRLALPLLVGPSRKSFLGRLTGDPVDEREVATQAACAVAAFAGADAVRVHDAASATRAVTIGRALREARRKELT